MRCQVPWSLRIVVVLGVVACAAVSGFAQSPQRRPYRPARLTAADYERATRFLAPAVTPLAKLARVQPNWRADGTFWYRDAGGVAVNVDPVARTKAPCTDCVDSRAARPGDGAGAGRANGPPSVPSPDRTRTAFVRDFNLWVRDVATGRETRLTTDGTRDFGYATDNAGWVRSDEPVLLWSPDSSKIATFQHDGRGVGEMYLYNTREGHPTLDAWKYPLPGDDKIFMIERVVVDVSNSTVTRLTMPPDPHRSSVCDHVVCGGRWADVEWAPDSRTLAFVSTSRDHKTATLRVADAGTGAVRDVFQESVATYFESGSVRENWRYLPASNEFVWFSERDDWGQLYLYDLTTGALKRQITSGRGNVAQVTRVDERSRQIWFWGVGKDERRDPYFRHLYRIGFDGTGLTLLTPADGHHSVVWSPDEAFLIDTYSKPDAPPVVELREGSAGGLVLTLETSDITALTATGWRPPTPFSFKCRDGVTDCHGLLYTPQNLDRTRRYPLINRIYPGPQTGSIGSRTFSASRGDDFALTALGFAVVEIDGMGTDGRSKRFHDAYYGNMGDNTLPDQVLGMRELAKRFTWIDLDRVGIWGHSGGGFAAAGAMFHHPDLFKVGIAESGNHDNRVYEDDWAEKWQGLLGSGPSQAGYLDAANQTHASKLKGKLLLAHGGLDDNVPIISTYLLVDALVKANKDFDLIVFPNAGHGYGADRNYMMRRRWDYFVKWLLGAEPPAEFAIRG